MKINKITNMTNKSITKVTPTEILEFIPGRPDDYHCSCEYCTRNFLGQIKKGDLYYHSKAKETYFPKPDPNDKHLDAGHFQGYRWAVQNLTEPGDWILDPTVGTGTAIIEAINNGRNGIGIELEYPHIAQKNIDAQYSRPESPATGKTLFRQGNAKYISQYLNEWGIEKNSLQLIINGTPYPTMGSKSSDSPERKAFTNKVSKEEREYFFDDSFDYQNVDNFGTKKGSEFWKLVNEMYWDSIEYLKPGGYFVILIKDMMQNSAPYLLHKQVIDHVLEKNALVKTNRGLEYYGAYVHKHYPMTLFMLTYPKRFPDVQIPLYQTGIILRKTL